MRFSPYLKSNQRTLESGPTWNVHHRRLRDSSGQSPDVGRRTCDACERRQCGPEARTCMHTSPGRTDRSSFSRRFQQILPGGRLRSSLCQSPALRPCLLATLSQRSSSCCCLLSRTLPSTNAELRSRLREILRRSMPPELPRRRLHSSPSASVWSHQRTLAMLDVAGRDTIPLRRASATDSS